jgi:hypothetical protein
MANTVISLRSSGESGNTPLVGELSNGELALNFADGILFYKTATDTLGQIRTVEPSGLDGEIQFNDSGVFGSNASLTFDKTTGVLNAPNVTADSIASRSYIQFGDGTRQYSANVGEGGGGNGEDATSTVRANSEFFIANGVVGSFTLSSTNLIGKVNNSIVTVDGLTQIPGVQYNASANSIVFSALPVANSLIEIRLFEVVDANSVIEIREFVPGNSFFTLVYDEANNASNIANIAAAQVELIFDQSNAAFDQANTATVLAQESFDQANTATVLAQESFDQANTATTLGQDAFNQANTAFDQSNTATTLGQDAFNQANTAFDQANTAADLAQEAFDQANTAADLAQEAFDQANTAGGGDFGFINFTTPGTWTKPTGLKYIKVTVVGGGGGGGGARGAAPNICRAAGGGAGGGTAVVFFPAPTIPGPVPVTVGAAGNAGAAPATDATTTNGTAGGTSSFGTFATATGGSANSGLQGNSGGAGASPSPTSLNIGGGGSGAGGIAPSTVTLTPGVGGTSTMGGGGRARTPQLAGSAGRLYGGGGSGGNSRATTGVAGGAGAAGVVIVEEFY